MNKKRNKGRGKQNFSNSQEKNGTSKAQTILDNHNHTDPPTQVAMGTLRNVYDVSTSQLCCGKAFMTPVLPHSMANSFAQPNASSTPQHPFSGTRPTVPLTGISYASGLIPPTGSYEMEIASHGSFLYKVDEESPKRAEESCCSGTTSQEETKDEEGWINYLLSFIY